MELLCLLGKDTSGLPCLSPHGFTSRPSPPLTSEGSPASGSQQSGSEGTALLETALFWGQKWLGTSLIEQNTQLNRVGWICGSSTAPYLGMRTECRRWQDDEGRVSLWSISENTLVPMVRGLQRLQVHSLRSFDKCVPGTATITSTIENTYITRFPCAIFQSLRPLAPGTMFAFCDSLFHFSRISCIWHFLLSIFWEPSTWLPILVCRVTLISSIPLYTFYNLFIHSRIDVALGCLHFGAIRN